MRLALGVLLLASMAAVMPGFSSPASATTQYSLLSPSWTPGEVDHGTTTSTERGVSIKPLRPGFITAVRFYKAAANTGTHIGRVWDENMTQLATVTFTGETASGWQQANFSSPVAVNAYTEYTISYSAPNGHYSVDDGTFSLAEPYPFEIVGSPSSAPAGTALSGPTSDSYGVDFVFEPTELSGCPCTWFDPSFVPGTVDTGPDAAVEIGMIFSTYESGYITGVRFYKAAANTGTHTGSLWDDNGTLLATVTFTGETASGWQQADFALPVLVQNNTDYVVSYHAPNGHYSFQASYFTGYADNYPFHTGIGAGRWRYSTGLPPTNSTAATYAVDAVFVPIDEDITVTASIDPYMSLSVGSHGGSCNGVSQTAGSSSGATSVLLGHINSLTRSVGAQSLQVQTNAVYGYRVVVRYTGAPSNGTGAALDDISGSNASPGTFPSAGTEAFGYTTSDSTLSSGTPDRFTNPSAGWAKMTTSNEEISYASAAADKTICIAYQAGTASTTPPGNYSTAVVYSAIANF